MFVLLNGTPGCDLAAIAEGLCRRENGAVLLLPRGPESRFADCCAILKDQAQAALANGHTSFCVPQIFESHARLAQLRRVLHPLDDESYAFRIIVSETEFARQAAGTGALMQYRAVCAAQEREADLGDMGVEVPASGRSPAEIGANVQAVIREPVELSPYDSRWVEMYTAHETALRGALGALAPRIDHIGSTAVEGLCAKPVIDIQIVVPEWKLAVKTIGPLRRLGFHFMDYPQNDARMFFRNFPRTCHIHVVAPGQEADDHLRFRDILRANTQAREEYAALKAKLREQHLQRRARYTDGKGEFIRKWLGK